MIKSCIFENNFAKEIGGAILFTNKIRIDIQENLFIKNEANYYGDNFGSDPFRLKFENNEGIF